MSSGFHMLEHVHMCKFHCILSPIAAVYCKAAVLISKDQDLSHATLDDLYQRGHVKDVVKTAPRLSSTQSWKEDIELYVITCTLIFLSVLLVNLCGHYYEMHIRGC